MNIFGIDYSYTSPAITLLGSSFETSKVHFMNYKKGVVESARNYHGTLLEKTYPNDMVRYETIARWACKAIHEDFKEGDMIVLEGYAFGARTGLTFNIAENGGMLKYHLWKVFGVTPVIVPPTTVKKYWTGKGNAKKEEMVATLKEKEGIDIVSWMGMKKLDSPAHDIVDSYAIASYGRDVASTGGLKG